jgi:hypothetical protein
MSGDLPTSEVEAVDNGLGTITRPATNIGVFLGVSSRGPWGPRTVTLATIESIYGTGPLVKKAAYAMKRANRKAIVIRLPKVPKAGVIGALDISNIEGTAVPTVTGTPTGVAEVLVEILVGGTIGLSGITYRFSLNGGTAFTVEAALGTATTIALAGTGLTVQLTSGQSFVAGDFFAFPALPGSAALLRQTVTRANTTAPSTASMAVSGSPEDDYEVIAQVTAGGAVNVAGSPPPAVRYSLDRGGTWSLPRRLVGTALVLLDGKTESSGLTITFGAGYLDTGDRLAVDTTAPAWQVADFDAAVKQLDTTSLAWSFLVAVTGLLGLTPGEAISLGGTMDDLEAAQRFTFLLGSARPHLPPETIDAWEGLVPPSFDTVVNNRLSFSGSAARIKCPLTSRMNRRPWAWVRVPRILRATLAEDEGRKKSGALWTDVRIHDDDGNLVEVDARFRPTAWDHRLVTATTYRGEVGTVFPTESRMLHAAAGDDIVRVPMRRVQDVASALFQAYGQEELVDNIEQQNAADGDKFPGAIKPYDARRVETTYKDRLEDALAGQVSALQVKVDETDTSFGETGILAAELDIVSVVWVLGFRGKVKYVPADDLEPAGER